MPPGNFHEAFLGGLSRISHTHKKYSIVPKGEMKASMLCSKALDRNNLEDRQGLGLEKLSLFPPCFSWDFK